MSLTQYTRFKPKLSDKVLPEPNFTVEYSKQTNLLHETKTLDVSPTEELTPNDFKLLHETWNFYKERVTFIMKTVLDGNCRQINDSVVHSLCMPVRIVSQILCKVYPLRTTGFYNLPLFNTASEKGTNESRIWVEKYTNWDHWGVFGEEDIWIAWRQESSYFYVVYKKGTRVTRDEWTPTLQRIEELITNVQFPRQSLFNRGSAVKMQSYFEDLDILCTEK